jgi:hypothetical protein
MKNYLVWLFFILVTGCRKETDEPLPFVYFNSVQSTSIPTMVSFSAQPSVSGEISWDFGNGQHATGLTVTHNFSTESLYKVTASLHSGNGNASRSKNVNASNIKTMTIHQVEATAPPLNVSGLPWDTEVGETAPDIYIRIYGATGNQVIPGTPVYSANSFSLVNNMIINFSVEDPRQILYVKLFDHDPGGTDQIMGVFPFDFDESLLGKGFPASFNLLPSSGGGSMLLRVAWSQ